MHSRLYRQLASIALVAGIGVSVSGCQSTRHSNTMIFGTNTTVGLKVGTNVNQVPEIMLAYDRQEAVIMPLVANVEDDGNYQTPCDLTKTIEVEGGGEGYAIHPCLLVGINGSASDSYSVLASFGAKLDTTSSSTDARAKGGLAQYFATGMAAQLLAKNGGAAVVSVGGAAEKAAETANGSDNEASLFSNPAAYQRGVARGQSYNIFHKNLIGEVGTTENPTVLTQRIEKFQGASKDFGLAAGCTTAQKCVATINSKKFELQRYYSNTDDAKKLDKALQDWAK